MKLDRAFQLQVLQQLADIYPEDITDDWTIQHEHANANIAYLAEQRLIEERAFEYLETPAHHRRLKIRHTGLDFLAEDGGLSAILGVVTVKLHDESLEKIQQWIQASDATPQEKKRFLDQLRSLPAETTKHLVMKIVDAGLANAPAAWNAIQTCLTAAQ